MKSRCVFVFTVVTFGVSLVFGVDEKPKTFTNSLGMKFIRIEPGTFMMGWEGDAVVGRSIKFEHRGWYISDRKEPALWEGIRPGLVAAIFNNSDVTEKRTLETFEQVNIDWNRPEAEKQGLSGKSVRWRGLLKAPVTGVVSLTIEANGKVHLAVDHKTVIEGDGKQKSYTADIEMSKGRLVPIAIDTEQTLFTGLYWSWPGQKKVLVPKAALWHSASEYNMALAFVNWIPGKKSRVSKLEHGDFDEMPRHKVTITKPFYISETEVTIEQFRQFKADYPGYDNDRPYASGISWNDAAAFCKWLSEKEGKPYRLPTEAEWEYVCRAGTYSPFWSGDDRPEPGTANPWGVKNMHTGVAEWCLDWYGIYPEQAQIDPVGPSYGWTKVVRGGGLDWTVGDQPYYARSANRAAVPPSFGPPPLEYQFKQLQNARLHFKLPKPILEMKRHEYKIAHFDDFNVTLAEALNTPFRYGGLRGRWSIRTSGFIPGRHRIGFRVVQAPMPQTKPRPFVPPFVHRCVKQKPVKITQGPDPQKPYYRTRLLFPDLAGESLETAWKLGLERGYGGGHHNSALAVLDNGDLMALYYNTNFGGERDACVSLMCMRLRRGTDEWDMPSPWPDNVDCDDEAPVLWNDNGTLWLFWGSPRQNAGYPFQWVTSTDNGATWGQVHFPLFDKRVGPYSAQPINSAFRDSMGTIYLAVDGSHTPITSELFASADNGRTWYDTGGRTYGRHSTFIILEDDVIMAFGGKQAEINGFHPLNISRDGGRSYEVIPSTLPALGGGRRASLIKLASGRLLYVADMHLSSYRKLTPKQCPPGFEGEGAYVALSEDKGKTWRVRKLTGGNVTDEQGKPVKVHTVSYVTARQGPDGIIHIITSHNHPDLHFELNEAWILQDPKDKTPPVGHHDSEIVPGTVRQYREEHPNGITKVVYSAGIGDDGRFLLHGKETWYYENGQKQWQAEYKAGKKVGTETYWSADGKKQWEKVYAPDGTYQWTVWGPDGKLRAKSTWEGKKLLSYQIFDR